MSTSVTAVVLAAGSGTRMKSATAKVLHPCAGRSLIAHALHAVEALTPVETIVVIGHQGEQVRQHIESLGKVVSFAEQTQARGTGDAVAVALHGRRIADTVVITYGDVPLLTPETLSALLNDHDGRAITILSADVPDPTGYGRIVRDSQGRVMEIREQRDADEEIARITEINSGIMAVDADFLTRALPQLSDDNAQQELYLTDIVAIAVKEGLGVGALVIADAVQTEGVNDRSQLANLAAEMNQRICRQHMLNGVSIIDPLSTWIDADVVIGPDTVIAPHTQLHGATVIGAHAQIGPDCTLRDVQVGDNAVVLRTHGMSARIGDGASIGPFAYLRPGSVIDDGAKVGAFVEVKNSHIGPDAKVPHLSYVGDADIGEGANIGAGTIFANYDGQDKHRTRIGKHARTGSDNVFVAPVIVGDGAFTAAGTTVRDDVPPGALAHNDAPQKNVAGWVEQKRPNSDAAKAAKDTHD